MLVQAIVTKLVDGAPFQQSKFPHTNPNAMFHPNTAAGKLNAVMIPINLRMFLYIKYPRGFHYSII